MKGERQFFIIKLHEIDPDIDNLNQYLSYILATRLQYVEWHLGMYPKWSTICRKEGIGCESVMVDQDRNQDRK